MFRKEVNVISSFVGFSLQSLWSFDLKTWKKKAFATMPMAMEHQETGTLEELGIEFDRSLKMQLVQQKLMQILSCQRVDGTIEGSKFIVVQLIEQKSQLASHQPNI